MSENKPKDLENEEVDLGQLFNAIGRLIEKLFAFIGKVFQWLFSSLIYTLKPFVNNFKLILIVVFAAALLGFIAEKFKTPVYESDMLVRPYFGSKYELSNNVNYFNALIGEKNFIELGKIFEIDSIQAKTLVRFEMQIGPETDNDLLLQYDAYIKSIDSSLAVEVTYDEFIENRGILNANVFAINAIAKKNDVFLSLEKGFIKTFENDYSKKLREKRDDTIKLRRVSLQKQLEEVEKLQEVYVNVIKKESEKSELTYASESMFPLQQTKRETKEYDLLQKELQIRSELGKLEEILSKDDAYFDILSGFEAVGTSSVSLEDRYSLVFPIITFVILILSYFLMRCFIYIKNYGS